MPIFKGRGLLNNTVDEKHTFVILYAHYPITAVGREEFWLYRQVYQLIRVSELILIELRKETHKHTITTPFKMLNHNPLNSFSIVCGMLTLANSTILLTSVTHSYCSKSIHK